MLVAALIIIITAASATYSYFGSYLHKPQNQNLEANLSYGKLIKPEDSAPLPIPPDLLQGGKGITVPILMYHHIGHVPAGADAIRRGLTISPENFLAQVQWLKNNGYQSVTLQTLYDRATGRPVNWPDKPVILTFDDGYDDTLINVPPVLNEYGFTGTFAIITQFPGTTLGNNSYATWEQIAAAQAAGMEIVCHTQNHFDGSNPEFTGEYIYQNLSGCQHDLASHLGGTEPFLIYPYGHSTDAYVAQAKKAGFVMALTVHTGRITNPQDLFHLPRIRVNPNEPIKRFQETVTGIFPRTATSSPGLYGK